MSAEAFGEGWKGGVGSPSLLPFKERTLVTDTQRLPHPIKWRLSSVMKDSWRLICGRELCDLSTDPEQRNDISAQHPDVVAELRAEYEKWWTLCSRQKKLQFQLDLSLQKF